MLRYAQFAAAAPTIAEPIRAKLTETGLAMLGTVRADGSPRVSPIEVQFHGELLTVGMMPGSTKALDVLRDPRFCLVTPLADKRDMGGEGKLFGQVRVIDDLAEIRAVLAVVIEETGMTAEDFAGSHFFELLVTGAAWQHVEDDTFCTRSWAVGGAVRERRRTGAAGLVVEVPAG